MNYISLIAAIIVTLGLNMAVKETGVWQHIGLVVVSGWIGWVTAATT